jgi:hypothetical protein
MGIVCFYPHRTHPIMAMVLGPCMRNCKVNDQNLYLKYGSCLKGNGEFSDKIILNAQHFNGHDSLGYW